MPKTYTFWYSVLAAITGIVQQFAPFIPADKMGAVLGIVAAIGAAIHGFEDSTKPPVPSGLVRFLPWLLVGIVCLPVTGCAFLAPQIDRVAKEAGKAVTWYCLNVTDETARENFRAKVNETAAPNSIAVTCANGTPTLRSSP